MNYFFKLIFATLISTLALNCSFADTHTIELSLNSNGTRLIDPGDRVISKGDVVIWKIAAGAKIEWIQIKSIYSHPFDRDFPSDNRAMVTSGKVRLRGYNEWKYTIVYKIRSLNPTDPIELDPKIAVRPTPGPSPVLLAAFTGLALTLLMAIYAFWKLKFARKRIADLEANRQVNSNPRNL